MASKAGSFRHIAGLALLACAPWAHAGLGNLYPSEVLERWHEPMAEDISAAFREDLLPAAAVRSAEDHERLGDVQLVFPLHCPGAPLCTGDSDPFTYMAGRDMRGTPVIVLSISSLRFWGDLALAYAWLQRNDKATDTPGFYVAMLRYRQPADFRDGRYPRPLEALGIPEDEARADPAVMRLFGNIFTSGVFFILAHEMAHHAHRHPGYGPDVSRAQARANEAQADRWALDLLASIGQHPGGAVFLMTAWAHASPSRWDFPDQAAYEKHLANTTHPLDADRLAALSAALRKRADAFARKQADPSASRNAVLHVADEVHKLASLLADEDVHEGIRIAGSSMTIEGLQPRPASAVLSLPSAGPSSSGAGSGPFEGVCEGEMTDGATGLPVRLRLMRQGRRVTGEYSLGIGIGRIDGALTDGKLVYRWRLADSSGAGVLTDAGDGTLQGTWGYGRATAGAGVLNCTRVR